MVKIKFQRTSAPAGSVEFSRNPSIKGDYQRKKQFMQPKDFSASGDIYIYNKGIEKNYRILHWKNIPAQDLTNFLNFIQNVSVGAKNTFIFTDYDGSQYTALIVNADDIVSKPVAYNRESLTVELLIIS